MIVVTDEKMIPILRQRNPSGRLTYWQPLSRGRVRRLTRPEALYLVEQGEGYWAGEPHEREGGPGATSLNALVLTAMENGDLELADLTV